MKWEKLLMKLQIFVETKWIFLMRMYKQENTVHNKMFSISLSVDACLLISLQVLAAYPSRDGHPRAGHQEEPLDLRVRQNRSKRRSQAGAQGKLPWLHDLSAHHRQWSENRELLRQRQTYNFLQFPQIPRTNPFQPPHSLIYTQCPLSSPASLGLK